ncbi:hypothetical protein C8J56DRAFT_1045059 [Mycena floridula]|nr:hypothetical protein C8J56DRAFT_1045059 [Mycena floridula]
MPRHKLYHSPAERRAAKAQDNKKYRARKGVEINAQRRQDYRDQHEKNAARQQAIEKRDRLARQKRQTKAQKALPQTLSPSVECSAGCSDTRVAYPVAKVFESSTVLEQLENFTCRNPRRFLQAVVTDYIETRHRPSLFATVAQLQAIIEESQNLKGSIDNDKGKLSLLLFASWANEIRIEVTRSYDFTVKRFRSRNFLFQQAHSNDGLGFTVAEE